ncbi:DNA segregation ATPase FtsK/SpoIIIE, S-DNA-T family [Caloranaerobacter azorensis DSM 13643]|uniref:DNA segregation ATPase FtsK/SpoIIIE, S-DNA-T family n=1 Tax=Caloranaerobacter azorensis DSM 13643 TaxID=1121264 RepID=A0A1M5UW46_9FIRM|nr:DNA segregation ATPase FtsK/SpoIIIE, S-DNA-T family [Caloranaerobacter azorensis DSM 13643]
MVKTSNKKGKKTKNKRKKSKQSIDNIGKEILGIIIITISILIFTSLYNYSNGYINYLIRDKILKLTGAGSILFPVLILIIGILFLFSKFNNSRIRKIIYLLMLYLCLLTLFEMRVFPLIENMSLAEKIKISIVYASNMYGGGLLGAFFAFILLKLFGLLGSYIILISTILIMISLLIKISYTKMLKNCYSLIKKFFIKTFKNQRNRVNLDEKRKIDIIENMKKENILKETEIDEKIKILDFTKDIEKQQDDKPKLVKDDSNDNINSVQDKVSATLEDFKLPTIDLLDNIINRQTTNDKTEIINNVKKLERTLLDFGIEAKVVQVSKGPTITRFELQPAPGVKVSKIVNLADDLALSLASSDIRIEAPIPGKSAIGIEVPNKIKSDVRIREVLLSKEYMNIKTKIPFALGQDIAGNPIVANLEKMPHLLIAGATGSGKSVCINTLIVSILFKSRPDEVKLLMIDPKVVELSVYNGIPHLLIPVVTDPKKASIALNWAVNEMTRRYKLFSEMGVRDLHSYNKKLDKERIDEKLPQIVVIIDELADLMMVAPNEVEESICRLAQMARAAGIHLIIATQRPSVDVITGTIKANIPSRISFAVSSQADSRTILDMNGAEKLLGKGDMLYYPVGISKPIRVQGAYISDKEVERIVAYLREYNNEENYKNELLESVNNKVESNDEAVDELLQKAIELVVEHGQASISLLQRKFRIGYSRAARLIDEMEARGIVGGYEGSKPRKVLVTKEDLKD